MNTSKDFANAILKRHSERNFADVHALIPKYARHIYNRINADDNIEELKNDLKEIFLSDISATAKFDLLANWMLEAKNDDTAAKQNHVSLTLSMLNNKPFSELAIEIISGTYFSVHVSKFSNQPRELYNSNPTIRLNSEDIIVHAIDLKCPFDEYTKFIFSERLRENTIYSSTAVNIAIEKDNPAALSDLLDLGCDIHEKNKFGTPPMDAFLTLINASEKNENTGEMLDILVKHGLDINDHQYGNYLFEVKNTNTLRWMLDHGHTVDNAIMLNAITNVYNDVAKFILKEHFNKIDITAVDEHGNTLLHNFTNATKLPDIELFTMLLHNGIDFERKNKSGVTVESILLEGQNQLCKKCLSHLAIAKENKALNSLIEDSDHDDFMGF